MEYRNKIKLEGLVIRKYDFDKIAELLFNKKEKEGGKVIIKVDFEDGFGIEAQDDMQVFDNHFLIEKNACSINIKYRDDKYINKIDIEIKTEKYFKSSITIIGDNKDSFSSICKQLEERVKNIKKQRFIWKLSTSSYAITMISAASLISIMFTLLYTDFIKNQITLTILFSFIISVSIFGKYITEIIANLFPCIELDFGNEEVLNRIKVKRNIKWLINVIFLSIVIPIILYYFQNK